MHMLGAHARLRMGPVALEYDVGLHRRLRIAAERREGTIWDTRLATPNAGTSERVAILILLSGSITWHGEDGWAIVAPAAFLASANQVEGAGGRWLHTFRSEGSPFSTVEVQVARALVCAFDRPTPLGLAPVVVTAARAHAALVHGQAAGAHELREGREQTTRALLHAIHVEEVLTVDLATELEPMTMTDQALWSVLAPLVEDFEILPSLDGTGAKAGLSARQLTRRLEGFLARLELPWGGWREVTRGYRLKVAVMLLSSEELPIADVARRCGYSSAEALAHALTTEGLPAPSELRRRLLANLG